MQFINHILSGLALFAFTTFAAPTERATTIPDFQITALETHRTSNATGAGQNVTVCFAVTDPSTLGNSTTTCNATWTLGSAYPQDSYVRTSTSPHRTCKATNSTTDTLPQLQLLLELRRRQLHRPLPIHAPSPALLHQPSVRDPRPHSHPRLQSSSLLPFSRLTEPNSTASATGQPSTSATQT